MSEAFGSGLRPLEAAPPPSDKAQDSRVIAPSLPLALSLLLIVLGLVGITIAGCFIFGVAVGLFIPSAILLILGVLVGFTS